MVALESTIITHGLPRPKNLEVALEIEQAVRQQGAVPATIAMLHGDIHVGLTSEALEQIASREDSVKASVRDLAILGAKGAFAGTTVAATSHIAALAGIRVFATGGLGGVHRDARESWDESADLYALAKLPIAIICAGVKSILDVAATLERLETLGVGVVGYRTNSFPGFYLTDSGFSLEHRVDDVKQIAQVMRTQDVFKTNGAALVIANPLPPEKQMDFEVHAKLLEGGLAAAAAAHIVGKDVTPFLLEYFHHESDGESLRANIEIILSNATLASEIAVEFARGR
ncbi:pseudouridine-5'-phosphate glycosidase [mine drainage metagenome]|uniref:Pseudouridine-5'-phosphate glycosidase n=1 Tax=mine drainage metagenome TaxID=410659 RepID=A0A1J5PD52_9ZZZZ